MYIDIATELINTIIEDVESETEDEWFPQTIALRRTRKSKCKMCGDIMGLYVPRDVPIDSMICIFCENSIIRSVISYRKNMIKKRHIKNNIIPELNREIIEFGMRPDRTRNTLLFEYNWNL
jgi:hypothetical protein